MSTLRNTLSIDVEEWWHLNYDSMADQPADERQSRVAGSTRRLLEMMEQSGARATFFFLGSVAEQHPELVREAQAAGHEIASHGYAHELVYQQSRQDFHADVARSLEILTDITGQPVRGYRAPSWSINGDTPWFYEVLAELGFDYSASLFPFKTYLYGDDKAPLSWFANQAGGRQVIEVPTSVTRYLGRRIPFSGGFYFRALPLWAIRWATRRVNRQRRPAIYYLHPREIDPGQPRLPLPFVDKQVTYLGLRGCERKLARLLAGDPTTSIVDYLESEGALSGAVTSTETDRSAAAPGAAMG